jgi:meso-butanediol dehydrogenase/(S,S)-butanediol dehydrogenase/diacetyl reductase
MRLIDRTAIVTGGGSGIGRAIVELFAREGAPVVVADRISARAHDVADQIKGAGGRAVAVEADVTQAIDVAHMVALALATFGRLDILVNNAGWSEGDDILSIDEATWDLNLQVDLKSVFLCSKEVLPHLLAQKSGAIVNISSVNGLTGMGEEAYSAAKAGVINLTRNMAVKYGPQSVRVNCICPGTIRTPIWRPRLEKDPQAFERLSKWYPLGRVGEPEDVANAALFLASEEAAWITGTTLLVDGGLTAGNYRMSRELLRQAEEINILAAPES